MTALKKLFQQTVIYGIGTVLPRILAVLLVPLYTSKLTPEEFGEYAQIFAWIIFVNVILSYGMETAFFRFLHKHKNEKDVQSTALTSIAITTIFFLILGLLFYKNIALVLGFKARYILWTVWIVALDAFAIIPFAWFRAKEKPLRFTTVKILNVCINLGLNVFFLLFLSTVLQHNSNSFLQAFDFSSEKVAYIFIANLVASAVTFVVLIPQYFNIKFGLNKALLKQMLRYGFPIMIAGIAFAINESFDKILLGYYPNVSDAQIGAYAACYKIGVFMTLFITAFKMGVEPYFFKQAETKNAKETYAKITYYFVIMGSLIFLVVVAFVDLIKQFFIPNQAYWNALYIVPIILLANLFLGIYHNLSVWYKMTDKTKYGALISVFGAIITLSINLIFIPTYGFTASAWATLTAYGTMMLVSYFFGKKYYKVPYNIQKIVAYLLSTIVLASISFVYFRGQFGISVLLILIFFGIIYANERKDIHLLLNKNKA